MRGCIIIISTVLWMWLLYTPAFNGPFVLDDHSNIPQTRIDQLTYKNILNVAVSNDSGVFGRPIPVISFALNHYFTGSVPYWFKVTNWVIHLVNGLLIYILSFALINRIDKVYKKDLNQESIKWISIFVALLWLMHPLQVSTVMYVVQRMTQLMVLFTLLALIVFVYGRNRLHNSSIAIVPMIAAVVIFGTLAILCKENGVLVIGYIVVLELIVYRFDSESLSRQRLLKAYYGLFVVIPIVAMSIYILYSFGNMGSTPGADGNTISTIDRLRTEPGVILMYLKMIMIPNIDNMGFYYDYYPVTEIYNAEFFISAAIILILIVSAVVLRRKAPVFVVGVGIFVVSHLIESTFIPLELVFEHRNYLALFGIALPLAWYLVTNKRIKMYKRLVPLIGGVVLSIVSIQTYSRSLEWADEYTFNSIAVASHPESIRARTWLAVSLINKGNFQKAIDQYQYIASELPGDAYLPLAILQARCIEGKFSEVEYDRAVSVMRDGYVSFTAAAVLGNIAHNQRKGFCDRPNEKDLIHLYSTAIKSGDIRLPQFAETVFLGNYANLLKNDNQLDSAISVMRHAESKDPENIELLIRLAQMLIENADVAHARAVVEKLRNTKVVKMGAFDDRIKNLEQSLIWKTQNSDFSKE